MDANQLFLATLDDLGSRSQPGRSDYDVLTISALIRKLLLDAGRLTDEVNRPHRLRLRFVANRGTPPTDPRPVFWSVQDGLDPNTARPGRAPEEMSRDQFLAVTILEFDGVGLTVRDVVDYLANVGGGVHHSQPTTAKEFALASVESELRVGGYPPALRSLLAVARVTLHALEPLRSTILAGMPPD
jgi:hypothetical protein